MKARDLNKGFADGIESVSQCRWAWLQNERRFDLVYAAVGNRRDVLPASTRAYFFSPDFLPTPGREDYVGRANGDLVGGNNTILGGCRRPFLRKNVITTSHLDQLGDPADSGNDRIVPC
jgi:hypothetical protein